jgi:predicted DNA-binding transcriptional regulator AlpA
MPRGKQTARHAILRTMDEGIKRANEQTGKEERPPGLSLQPRLIRLRDAPSYLGMDRNKFNAMVRPFLTEIPLGTQAVAFDRLEIDAWIEDYKNRNGRPGQPTGDSLWDAKQHRALSNARVSGTSTSSRQAAHLP